MTRSTATRAAVAALAALAGLGACGGAVTGPAAFDAQELRDAAADGARTGEAVVWLRRVVEVSVGVARDPAEAESRIRHHLAVARYGEGAEAPLPVDLLGPAGLEAPAVTARVVEPGGARPIAAPRAVRAGAGARARLPRVDPGQEIWTLTLPGVAAGAILEVTAELAVPGTLAADARWLAAPDGPTQEVLVRYDVPTAAAGELRVEGAEVTPLVVTRGGTTLHAVRLQDVRPLAPGAARVRYATRRASVRGYRQSFVTDWESVAGPYEAELLERATELRGGFAPPFEPPGRGRAAVEAAFRWVQGRPQVDDALAADWRAAHPLPEALRANTLNGTDKAQVLHWIVEAARIPHRMAVARGAAWPRLDPAFPAPGAFEHALVYIPGEDAGEALWLDPACLDCAPGQVRPALRGGQALLLPAEGERPVDLPAR